VTALPLKCWLGQECKNTTKNTILSSATILQTTLEPESEDKIPGNVRCLQ